MKSLHTVVTKFEAGYQYHVATVASTVIIILYIIIYIPITPKVPRSHD